MKTITPLEALIVAQSTLKLWGEYGEEMKKHGRGTDCTQTATGYSNDYFLAVINSAIESETQKEKQVHLIVETLKGQRDIANSRATNALIERDMLKGEVQRLNKVVANLQSKVSDYETMWIDQNV